MVGPFLIAEFPRLSCAMSLFFNVPQSIDVSVNVKAIPENHGADMALVGKNVWMALGQLKTDRVVVSVRPVRTEHGRRRDSFASLTCWAALDEEVRAICLTII